MLPNYRGGTPIQHQLINGEINSGITVFKMNDVIDGGDIYQQTAMSLVGNVNDIFGRMAELGSIITKRLITNQLNGELFFKPYGQVAERFFVVFVNTFVKIVIQILYISSERFVGDINNNF